MKLKDLLFNREKLRKYDELKNAIFHFELMQKHFAENEDCEGLSFSVREMFGTVLPIGVLFTPKIVSVILTALEAEIKKLDETEI